jgi:hypothetical protein
MSELMKMLLVGKAAERKRLAALSYEEKLTLLERMRDRGLLIKNPMVVQVSGNAVAAGLSVTGAQLVVLTPPVSHQLQDQLNTLRNSRISFVELRKQPAHCLVAKVTEFEPSFASPLWA